MPITSLLLASLPQSYSYVLAAAISSTFVLVYQEVNVLQHRKLAGVPYPYLYAERADAEADKTGRKNRFNCAQRAHQNTLETYTLMLFRYVTSAARPGSVQERVDP